MWGEWEMLHGEEAMVGLPPSCTSAETRLVIRTSIPHHITSHHSSLLQLLPAELQVMVICQCVHLRGLIARTCRMLNPIVRRTASAWAPRLNLAHSRRFEMSTLRGFGVTMCRVGHHVRELTLPLGTHFDATLVRDALARLPFLQVLRCFNCTNPLNGEQQPWVRLADACNNLREVRVQGLCTSPLSDQALQAFAKLSFLHTLCVPGSDITNAGLLKLAKGGQQLQHLNFSNCYRIRGGGHDDEDILDVLVDAENRIRHGMVGLLALIVSCGPSLQKLELANLGVDDDVMAVIGSQCRQLEELDVAFGVYDDDGASKVLNGCPLLKSLSVRASFINDPSLRLMASLLCPHLTALDLSGCDSLTADALIHLVQARPLHVLMLGATSNIDPAASNVHAMAEDEMDGPQVNAEVISALAATSFDSLRVFSVEHVAYLSTDDLLPLIQTCHNLCMLVCQAQGPHTSWLLRQRPPQAHGFSFLNMARNAFDPCWAVAEHAPFLQPVVPSWVGGGRQWSFGQLMRMPWNRTVLPDITLLTAPVETPQSASSAQQLCE